MRYILAFAALLLASMTFTALADEISTPDAVAQTEVRTEIGEALDVFLSDAGSALILLPNRLDKSKLDFTIDSLMEIDRWLGDVHTINRLQAGEGNPGETFLLDGRGDNTVIFAGLYLGEVIRLNAEQSWVWQPFEAFMAQNPAQRDYFGDEAGFDRYVLVSKQSVATPITQALKRALNGSVDSLHYIGQLLNTPVDLQAAMAASDLSVLSDISELDTPVSAN